MSVGTVASSAFSLILLFVGFLFIVLAAVDFLVGYGLVYCLILILIGALFVAISRWV
jgi:hypothetical protein